MVSDPQIPLAPLNVDEIAPPTPELELVARRRVDEIIKAWAHRLSVWGSGGTHDGKGNRVEETFSIADLAVAAYVQGVRDTAATNASMGRSSPTK